MNTLGKAAGKVLDALTAGLEVGDARRIDVSGGVYMVVHVDRLSDRTFSVAHYFSQNGDLVADPDGVFLRGEGGEWLPVSLQLCTGHYTAALELDANDKPTGVRQRALRELVSFGRMWLRNIAQQQGGVAGIAANITRNLSAS